MKTFHIILCIADLISFIGLLIASEVWVNIIFCAFYIHYDYAHCIGNYSTVYTIR